MIKLLSARIEGDRLLCRGMVADMEIEFCGGQVGYITPGGDMTTHEMLLELLAKAQELIKTDA